jgi:hypothetical protein
MARRDEGAYSPEICNRGATQPAIPPRRKTARGVFKTGSKWSGVINHPLVCFMRMNKSARMRPFSGSRGLFVIQQVSLLFVELFLRDNAFLAQFIQSPEFFISLGFCRPLV